MLLDHYQPAMQSEQMNPEGTSDLNRISLCCCRVLRSRWHTMQYGSVSDFEDASAPCSSRRIERSCRNCAALFPSDSWWSNARVSDIVPSPGERPLPIPRIADCPSEISGWKKLAL